MALPRLIAALFVLSASAARAEDPRLLPDVLGASELYAPDPNSGLALGGRDPLSYQLDGLPRPGVRVAEAIWRGVAWRFASDANRAAFLRDPNAFAPRIGGYDAQAAAAGLLVEADPDIFLIRSGRLYLFRTLASRDRFAADLAAAARAEAEWLRLQGLVVKG